MTTQFKAGQTYKNNRVTITVTRRTDKSVWFKNYEGKEVRRKIQVTGNKFEGLFEIISFDEFYNIDARFIVETTVTTPNETTCEETLETTVTTPETVSEPQDVQDVAEPTITPNEVPQDALTKPTETINEPIVAPLPTDVYEATREKLINRWDKLGQRLGQEKADKYRYTQACKIQGIDPDTTSFDEVIAEYRQYIKNINQQINELDIAQGLEPDED
jgi:hypothetical protein